MTFGFGERDEFGKRKTKNIGEEGGVRVLDLLQIAGHGDLVWI